MNCTGAGCGCLAARRAAASPETHATEQQHREAATQPAPHRHRLAAQRRAGTAVRTSPRRSRDRTPGRAPTGIAAPASFPGSATRSARAPAGWRGPTRPAAPLLPQNRRHRLGDGPARERPPAAQHLVQHAPEAEDVRAVVDGLAAHLLGGHVAHGADHRPGVGLAPQRGRFGVARRRGRRAALAREAEVEDLEATVARDDQVLGLEVAVDDALLVRRREALARPARAYSAAGAARSGPPRARRAASRPRAAPSPRTPSGPRGRRRGSPGCWGG